MQRLGSLAAIQSFLDETAYSEDKFYRCPDQVLAERTAHCVDGALLAAAALRRLGDPPLILDLRAERDDDHVIAVFRRHGHCSSADGLSFPHRHVATGRVADQLPQPTDQHRRR